MIKLKLINDFNRVSFQIGWWNSLGVLFYAGAFLAHLGLATRLPTSLSTEFVPGFVAPIGRISSLAPSEPIRFEYSESLYRGVDLLLQVLDFLL